MKSMKPFEKKSDSKGKGRIQQKRTRNHHPSTSVSAIASEYIFLATATISFLICIYPLSSFVVTVQAAKSMDPPPPPPPPPSRGDFPSGDGGGGRFYDRRRFDYDSSSDKSDRSRPSSDTSFSSTDTSLSSTTTPIHYNFPTMDASSILQSSPSTNDEQDHSSSSSSSFSSPPQTSDYTPKPYQRDPSLPSYASPRTDLLTRYTSASRINQLRIHLASSFVGLLLGSFLGRSTIDRAQPAGYLFASTFAFVSVAFGRGGSGNAYAEMIRTLGFSTILLWGRYWRDIRGTYGTGKHLKAVLGMGSRAPFPPAGAVENPWRYRPEVPDDPDFDMVKSLACVVLLGSFVGGNVPVPLLPTWIGGSLGALGLGSVSLMKSPVGDLMRTMGMRIVALVGEAMEVNGDLGTGRKVAVVCGRILDRTMVLDRKHRIREKVGDAIGKGYKGIVGVVEKARDDRNFQNQEEERGSDRERDRYRDRSRYRDMDIDKNSDRYRR